MKTRKLVSFTLVILIGVAIVFAAQDASISYESLNNILDRLDSGTASSLLGMSSIEITDIDRSDGAWHTSTEKTGRGILLWPPTATLTLSSDAVIRLGQTSDQNLKSVIPELASKKKILAYKPVPTAQPPAQLQGLPIPRDAKFEEIAQVPGTNVCDFYADSFDCTAANTFCKAVMQADKAFASQCGTNIIVCALPCGQAPPASCPEDQYRLRGTNAAPLKFC